MTQKSWQFSKKSYWNFPSILSGDFVYFPTRISSKIFPTFVYGLALYKENYYDGLNLRSLSHDTLAYHQIVFRKFLIVN
mgnify:CR=1 FL=1